jgi:ribonuclease P protein component
LSRRVGNAVVRNRIRRRLRAAFDAIETAGQTPFPSGTYLVSASKVVAQVPFTEVRRHVEELLGRVADEVTS